MTAAEAHITAQERLRALIAGMIDRLWRALPGYDEENVPYWLSTAVPLVVAAQRQSVSLTEVFLATALGRQPLGVNVDRLIGGAPRADVMLEEVYRRPFVTVWSDLKNGRAWEDAVDAGRERAVSTAQTDVQLAMRETLREVGQADDLILGYRRVPDAGACEFCRLVAGQRYTTDELMPVHNRCGCGVDVITAENRDEFTGKRENDLAVEGDTRVAVRHHGELGPVLTDASHDFTSAADIAA